MQASRQERPRILVIGAGINGLSAAWSAWQSSAEGRADITVLESASEVGGKARTRIDGDWLFEEGPTGFLSGEETIDRLIELAGLDPLPARAQAARRYVVRAGKAREIQANPLAFAKSGILSPLGLARMALEPFIPRGNASDESIWEFARRRLGAQAADRLISPMVLGVFAGDAKCLSLPSAFPRMAELEEDHGSLIHAMANLARGKKKSGGPAGPAGSLHSFAAGMQSLPRALAQRAPFEVVCNAKVSRISRDLRSCCWHIQVEGELNPRQADLLVLSSDPRSSARLLEGVSPAISRELASLTIPAVSVVGLSYPSRSAFPTGFGALIPRGEGFRILGCLFDSQLFDGRSPDGRILVRCMLGGATDPELAMQPADDLAAMAEEDLKRLFDIQERSETQAVVQHVAAIPQYEVGHAQLLQRIDCALEADAKQGPGLFLAGSHGAGVAFGKTAREGWRVGALAGEAALALTPSLK